MKKTIDVLSKKDLEKTISGLSDKIDDMEKKIAMVRVEANRKKDPEPDTMGDW